MTTEGGLLNGRLTYRQPAAGFRSGIEPVLLAASVAARPGQNVLEAGTGAGAALLCLHARVADVGSVGVEVDPEMAALAAANARANGFISATVTTAAIESLVLTQQFDHAMANPPYHQEGSRSPSPVRERAKRGGDALTRDWVAALAAHLRPRGSLTLIVPAGAIPACLESMTQADCRTEVIYPLWPKVGRPAKLVLIRGLRGSRSPMRLSCGLVLHQADGSFSDAAQRVLRGGEALDLR